MITTIKVIVLFILIFSSLVLFSCCIVAGRAGDYEEREKESNKIFEK